MWAVTGWALAIWLKSTLLLAALVAVAWLVCGAESDWFWAALVAAGTCQGR